MKLQLCKEKFFSSKTWYHVIMLLKPSDRFKWNIWFVYLLQQHISVCFLRASAIMSSPSFCESNQSLWMCNTSVHPFVRLADIFLMFKTHCQVLSASSIFCQSVTFQFLLHSLEFSLSDLRRKESSLLFYRAIVSSWANGLWSWTAGCSFNTSTPTHPKPKNIRWWWYGSLVLVTVDRVYSLCLNNQRKLAWKADIFQSCVCINMRKHR